MNFIGPLAWTRSKIEIEIALIFKCGITNVHAGAENRTAIHLQLF